MTEGPGYCAPASASSKSAGEAKGSRLGIATGEVGPRGIVMVRR